MHYSLRNQQKDGLFHHVTESTHQRLMGCMLFHGNVFSVTLLTNQLTNKKTDTDGNIQ